MSEPSLNEKLGDVRMDLLIIQREVEELESKLALAVGALEEQVRECAGFDEPPSNYWKDELLARSHKRAQEALEKIRGI